MTTARVGRFFIRAMTATFLFLLCATGGEAAELRKFALGYSTVGPAGTGLWMAKEIGAFDKYGINAELIFVSSLRDPKLIQELYADGVKFIERVPRLDAEALAPIVEFMGKKPIPVETIADNGIVNRLERDGFIDKLYGKR